MVGVSQAADRDAVANFPVDHQPAYAVKAGYLYKLLPFVDWPETAFEAPDSPFRLCIAGRDPFGGAAERIGRGSRVGGHRVAIVRLKAVTRGADCHLLFLAISEIQTPQQMLASVAGRPVLTVADEALNAPGAMVQFVTVDRRIRVDVRAEIARAAGLTVSSKLRALNPPGREKER